LFQKHATNNTFKMKIVIGGKDSTKDIGEEITKEAETLYDAELIRLLNGEKDLAAIGKNQKNGDSFLGEFIRILRLRNTIDYSEMKIPSSRKAIFLRLVRTILWKIVNPFHHWFAFRQNAVNRALLYAVEFEREERRKEIATLKSELEKIKQVQQKGK